MKLRTAFAAIGIALTLAGTATLPACKTKGPAEKTGEKIDDAVGETKEKAHDVKKDVEHAVDDATK